MDVTPIQVAKYQRF